MAYFFNFTTVTMGSAAHLDNLFAGGGTYMHHLRFDTWTDNHQLIGAWDGTGWRAGLATSLTSYYFEHKRTSSSATFRTPTGSAATGLQNHVALTWDSDFPDVFPSFYINGESVVVTRLSQGSGAVTSQLADNIITSPLPQAYFDDYRLYNIIKSPNEIRNIANSSGGDGDTNGLVGRFAADLRSDGSSWSSPGVGASPQLTPIESVTPPNYDVSTIAARL